MPWHFSQMDQWLVSASSCTTEPYEEDCHCQLPLQGTVMQKIENVFMFVFGMNVLLLFEYGFHRHKNLLQENGELSRPNKICRDGIII